MRYLNQMNNIKYSRNILQQTMCGILTETVTFVNLVRCIWSLGTPDSFEISFETFINCIEA
jgi:hypothetical protein